MPTLEDVINEWKNDSKISQTKIGDEIMRTPNLHAKYLEYYIYFKSKLAQKDAELRKMTYLRKKYYRGEMTKDELTKYGWDQYQGLKMSGAEFNQHQDIDPVLQPINEMIDMYKTAVVSIEYIMKQIQGREWSLKTLFEYYKYVSGG
jgi:hypothetical protein